MSVPATLRPDPLARPKLLAALVAEQLREMIVTGRLALGELVSENTVAEQLSVSRTPVRDAFARLEAERLLEIRPQRGTFVFQCDAGELRDICELREVLETGALRLALRRDRAALVATLAAQVAAAEPAATLGAAAYQPCDTAFHDTLIAAADNRELTDAYARISGRIRAVRHRLTRTAQQVQASQSDHRDIVAALAAADDVRAGTLLGRHVFNLYRFLRERIGDADRAASIGTVHERGGMP